MYTVVSCVEYRNVGTVVQLGMSQRAAMPILHVSNAAGMCGVWCIMWDLQMRLFPLYHP